MLLRRNDGAALSEWWCCSVGMMVLLRRNDGAAPQPDALTNCAAPRMMVLM